MNQVDPSCTNGRRLALVAWGEHEDGSDDVVVFTGTAEWDGKRLRMHRENNQIFDIPEEWLSRLKPVGSEVRDILLNADFVISVTIGDIGDEEKMDGFIFTGLKWPK